MPDTRKPRILIVPGSNGTSVRHTYPPGTSAAFLRHEYRRLTTESGGGGSYLTVQPTPSSSPLRRRSVLDRGTFTPPPARPTPAIARVSRPAQPRVTDPDYRVDPRAVRRPAPRPAPSRPVTREVNVGGRMRQIRFDHEPNEGEIGAARAKYLRQENPMAAGREGDPLMTLLTGSPTNGLLSPSIQTHSPRPTSRPTDGVKPPIAEPPSSLRDPAKRTLIPTAIRPAPDENPGQRKARVEREERVKVYRAFRDQGLSVENAIRATTLEDDAIRRRARMRIAGGTPESIRNVDRLVRTDPQAARIAARGGSPQEIVAGRTPTLDPADSLIKHAVIGDDGMGGLWGESIKQGKELRRNAPEITRKVASYLPSSNVPILGPVQRKLNETLVDIPIQGVADVLDFTRNGDALARTVGGRGSFEDATRTVAPYLPFLGPVVGTAVEKGAVAAGTAVARRGATGPMAEALMNAAQFALKRNPSLGASGEFAAEAGWGLKSGSAIERPLRPNATSEVAEAVETRLPRPSAAKPGPRQKISRPRPETVQGGPTGLPDDPQALGVDKLSKGASRRVTRAMKEGETVSAESVLKVAARKGALTAKDLGALGKHAAGLRKRMWGFVPDSPEFMEAAHEYDRVVDAIRAASPADAAARSVRHGLNEVLERDAYTFETVRRRALNQAQRRSDGLFERGLRLKPGAESEIRELTDAHTAAERTLQRLRNKGASAGEIQAATNARDRVRGLIRRKVGDQASLTLLGRATDATKTVKGVLDAVKIPVLGKKGLLLGVDNPLGLARAAKEGVQSLNENAARTLDRALRADGWFQEAERYGTKFADTFGTKDGGWSKGSSRTGLSDRLSLASAAERSKGASFNRLKAEAWAQMRAAAPNASDAELRRFAAYLNHATGEGWAPGGRLAGTMDLVGNFYDVKFLTSRGQTMAALVDTGVTGRTARRQFSKVAGAYGSLLVLAKESGAEISLDPDSKDFLMIRRGDLVIGPGAGFLEIARLVARGAKMARTRNGGRGLDASVLTPLGDLVQDQRTSLGKQNGKIAKAGGEFVRGTGRLNPKDRLSGPDLARKRSELGYSIAGLSMPNALKGAIEGAGEFGADSPEFAIAAMLGLFDNAATISPPPEIVTAPGPTRPSLRPAPGRAPARRTTAGRTAPRRVPAR